MGDDKCGAIAETAAHVVTSGDMSCLMHIEGLVRKSRPQSPLRFVHLAQILAAT
jgi:L-lactate dehydrogenase complex protein LldE